MRYTQFAAAAALYAAFAVYLYRHYFRGFGSPRLQDLFVLAAPLASLGCYVLSRRWVAGFAGSFFAGALYGFGPFTLGLARFHPTAGLLAAAIPWLFWPATFGPKGRWRFLRVLFSVLPFAAIVLFFQVAAYFRLYPVPIQLRLHAADVAGSFAPLVAANRQMTLLGFYHIPLAELIVGLCVLIAARRTKIMAILAVPTVLAFCHSVFAVSPIVWLAITMLCGSIIVGTGTQALVCAGAADRKWISAVCVAMWALAILALLSATKYFQFIFSLADGYAKLFLETAKMYLLGALAASMLFLIVRQRLRVPWLRQAILYPAIGIDIFLGARYIVDRIL